MKRQNITTFRQAVEYIDDVPRFTSKHSMEETKAFLHRLGDPDSELRIIHVAGTNGKGSVCAYMCSILEAAGYRVAMFTSPHLVCIRERFVADGEMISEEDFLRAFLRIYRLLDWDALERQEAEAYHPTYFEYLFFIAMLLFAEKKPDFTILETGVGGRLDATNSVGHKELSVITHIGFDHVGVLGDTLGKIASEKAGILRPGVPAVWWNTCEETERVFRHRAEELGIWADSVSENDYSFSNFKRKTIDFCLHNLYDRDVTFTLRTIAAYQMENCALAVRAVLALDCGRGITPEQIGKGVEDCFWAGRMEEVRPEVFADGAHNEDGIRAFLETVASDGHPGSRSLLFGVVKDKDYKSMIKKLAVSGLFQKVCVTHMHSSRALDTGTIADIFGGYPGCNCEICEDAGTAFCRMYENRKDGERIYVAGSLYLVGEIKELLGS
ncbi:MAG: bifunctional folylpolyglutamate synthase/dihydrofolate synthase [Lachnospiraceae bacterium]|nr:bifunctional folylpolyglutamate synthase/dihydrofolate synthase [Lachnospiraceae bacterium]